MASDVNIPGDGADIESGETVNHYRIVRKIGSGGMSDVYLAEDTRLQRQVALKFLSQSLSEDDTSRNLFIREAQAAASLKHPNVITIHEVSVYRGRPFFAMEFVEGTNLRELINAGPIAATRATEIIASICAGLSQAHEKGLVHRDIKPGNVLIDREGRVKLVDFGLAELEKHRPAGQPDLSAGTLSYMSPEQTRDEPLSPASDLFSLGVTFYEMLTGRRPFGGDYEASIVYAIANTDPPPMSECGEDIPGEIEEIVDRLLRKDPADRFAGAQAVAQVLEKLSGRRSEATDRRGRPHLFVALAALALAVVVVAIVLVVDRFDMSAPERKMVTVLPFENLGPEDEEYFADGITDAVTTNLARLGELDVISRASAMQYKNTEKSPQEIGAELGAAYLLTGTIHWDRSDADNRVRINTALVRVSDGANVWANSYERVLDKIFVVQSDIARCVTEALNVAVKAAERDELERVPTDNLEAYDLYLRGNEYFNRSWEREDIEIATQFYQQAIALDSSFADAYAMLSRGHASMYWEYFDRSEERRQQAMWAAQKSLELENDLVEGHLALGYCYYHCARDYEKALAEFDLALQNQPNNADLYNAIAAVQRRQGDLVNSVNNFKRALMLDPRSHLKAFDVGLTFGMMRRCEQADDYLVLTIALAPDWPLPYVYRAWLPVIHDGDMQKARRVISDARGKADLTGSKYYWWLARIVDDDYQKILEEMRPGPDTAVFFLQKAQLFRLLGDSDLKLAYADSARILLEGKLEEQPEDASFHSSLGLAFANLGMKAEAFASGQKAVELLPTSKEAFDAPFYILNLAEIMLIFGEHETATGQLQYLLTIPGFISPSYLKLDPLWEPLRGDPSFDSLINREI